MKSGITGMAKYGTNTVFITILPMTTRLQKRTPSNVPINFCIIDKNNNNNNETSTGCTLEMAWYGIKVFIYPGV